MRLPLVTAIQLIKILSMKGFEVVRQRGSHVQLKNSVGRLVTVPLHYGKEVGVGIVLRILRTAGITKEEFLSLLKRV